MAQRLNGRADTHVTGVSVTQGMIGVNRWYYRQRIEAVQREYPHFVFRHNREWEDNNILVSLMYAEDLMDQPFLTAYSDILFTGSVVAGLVNSGADIALGIDTDWRTHYQPRTQHPPHDADQYIANLGLPFDVITPPPFQTMDD